VPRIEVDRLRIAYRRAGAGPPVVLLHGYVGDGPSTWAPQIAGLSDAFDVVAWDAPGAGGSDDPSEDLGLAGYADCLARFVAGLDLERPHVAGISFGGIVALELARRHPGLARTLVLVSAYAGWRGSLPADVADARLREALALSEFRSEEVVETLLPTMFSPDTPRASVAAFAAAMRELRPAGFRAMARASAEDLRDALPHIDVPALVVHGALDERAPRAVAEGLHAGLPRSRLVVLPDAGHVCTLEAPDALEAAVRAFIREEAP
jgi:pimeloyl-ACP methyl ester carboxylesterase